MEPVGRIVPLEGHVRGDLLAKVSAVTCVRQGIIDPSEAELVDGVVIHEVQHCELKIRYGAQPRNGLITKGALAVG